MAIAADGTLLTVAAPKSYGPGEEIMLPRADVARLRKLGHLVDPERAPPSSSGRSDLVGPVDAIPEPQVDFVKARNEAMDAQIERSWQQSRREDKSEDRHPLESMDTSYGRRGGWAR